MRLAAPTPSIKPINSPAAISRVTIKCLAASARKILNDISAYGRTVASKLIKVRIGSILQRILMTILLLLSVQGSR